MLSLPFYRFGIKVQRRDCFHKLMCLVEPSIQPTSPKAYGLKHKTAAVCVLIRCLGRCGIKNNGT